VSHNEEDAGKYQKDQIKIHEGRHVESNVPLVGHRDGQSFCFLKVRDISEDDDAFAKNSEGVKRDPNCVPRKK
jgi:hypothetical protein